jgi:hypothetical protein
MSIGEYAESRTKELVVLGGVGLFAWAIYSSMKASKAEAVLETRANLRKIRDRFFRVGPDCDIQFLGPTTGTFEGDIAIYQIALEDWEEKVREDFIFPSIKEAVQGRRITSIKGVTAYILDEMFPECEWPPKGSLLPDCEWKEGSIIPECTWDTGEIFTVKGITWMTFFSLVLESCQEYSAESGFQCVTDSQTGDTVVMPVGED